MINLMEELGKLMKDKPLPYGRKPIPMKYEDNGEYQEALILCSPKSIIWKNQWRDESTFGCYVLENNEWMDYKLVDILYQRKPKDVRVLNEELPKNATQDEEWLYGIRCFYSVLTQYGDDVLKGDLEWTKETRYPPNPVHPIVVGEMYGAFERQKS